MAMSTSTVRYWWGSFLNSITDLKRFSQGRYSQKVSTCIDFPLVLDMSEYSAEKGGHQFKM